MPREGWTKPETGLQPMPENQQKLLTKHPQAKHHFGCLPDGS